MNKNKIYTVLLTLVMLTCIGCVDTETQSYYDNHNTLVLEQNNEIEDLYYEIDNIEVEAYDAYYLGDYKESKEKYILYQTKINTVVKLNNEHFLEAEEMYKLDKIDVSSYDYLKTLHTYSTYEWDSALLYAKYMLKSIDATNSIDEQTYYELALYHDECSILNRNAYNELEPPLFYI